jgi:hypothetical protein
VFVDRLSKYAIFLPCKEEGTDAPAVADLFYGHVFAEHGLPDDIVSDRGMTFTSHFWQRLQQLTRVKSNLSTSFHPQTDGQTERVNQNLEQYLRMYVNYQQDDWEELLPLAQFVYNDTKHSSTGFSPFFANFGYHPTFNLELPLPAATKYHSASADAFVEDLQTIHKVLRIEMERAQQQQKKSYDKRVDPAPDFKVGDKVWLSSRNIITRRKAKKLDDKRMGPFTIEAKIGSLAYRLSLPHQMNIHPVFHVSLLSKYSPNTIEGRKQDPPPLTIIDGEAETDVAEVLDSRTYHGKLQYRLSWVGLPPSENSWEDAEDCIHAADLISAFHQLHPTKPSAPAARRSSRH